MADFDSSLPIRTEAAGDVDVFLSDAVTPSQKLVIESDGKINANATQAGTWNIATLTGITNDVNIADGGNSITVDAAQLDIDDLEAGNDSVAAHLFDEAGVAFSASNPLPVVVSSDAEGDEIVNYTTSASVASDAFVNHDYTVTTAKTLLIDHVFASGSGKMKAVVLVNAVTKYVGFNSTANPNIEIPMNKILKGLSTQVVRITLTNLDNQAQDLYSTLSGLEI